MSVWIESHKALLTHPKVSSLEELMDWDTDKAIGKLHRFWWWCVDYAEDGSLMKYNDAQIGRAVGLNGDDCKRFVESMKTAGFIDTKPYFRVHDWWQYIGTFLRTRYRKAPQKWKVIQDAYAGDTASESTESTMNVQDSVQDGVQDGVTNQPNQPTKPNQPADPPAAVSLSGTGLPGTPSLRLACREAFDRWAVVAIGRKLDPARNEHKPIERLIAECTGEPPIRQGGEMVPRETLIPLAVDLSRQNGRADFKSVPFACGVIRNLLGEWALKGMPGAKAANGHELPPRRQEARSGVYKTL